MKEIERIARLSDELVERYGTRNPFRLADAMDIRVTVCPDFQKLRGMYKVILGKRFIFLNGNLKRREAAWTLAHELGHDALHREMAENSIVQDNFIMDMTLKPEYEANLFAANLLFDDGEVAHLLRAGESGDNAARLLGGEKFLLQMKIRIMESRGRLPS